MPDCINLTGKRFGRWTVLNKVGRINNALYWHCVCDCGKEKDVRGDHLRSGKTTSCGCLRTELIKGLAEKNAKHGMYDTRIYHIWQHMKQRCSPSCPKHEIDNYYGRGIKVCDDWANSFPTFYDWAISHGYSDDLSIDRIDSNGNYEPDNCRWATNKEQANNKRITKYITYNGETLPLSVWAEKIGISRNTVDSRLRRGYTEKEALFGKK
ncbi:hypothetical protein [uncultured Ruminococcus sp.]|uniref:hypothetical protein n=1 Tax=uncultured Ruminococcus sp. TaxID=165186 RepID=UPI0025CE5D8D|nr:hypothetical protein [uncultured Ruminococcus sp.]